MRHEETHTSLGICSDWPQPYFPQYTVYTEEKGKQLFNQ